MTYWYKRQPADWPTAKTTREQREQIRKEYAEMPGRKSYARVARKHGLATATVATIVKNKWRDKEF